MAESPREESGGEGAFGGVRSPLPDDVGRLRARIQVQSSRLELQEKRIAQLQREKDEAVAFASQQQIKLKGGEHGGGGHGGSSTFLPSRSQRRKGGTWGEGLESGEEERLREDQDALACENDRLQQRVEELERRNREQLQLLHKLQSRRTQEIRERRGGLSTQHGGLTNSQVFPTTEEGPKEKACSSKPRQGNGRFLAGGRREPQRRGENPEDEQEVFRATSQRSSSSSGRLSCLVLDQEKQHSVEDVTVARCEKKAERETKSVGTQTVGKKGGNPPSRGCLDTGVTRVPVSTSEHGEVRDSSRFQEVLRNQLGDIRQELTSDRTSRRRSTLRDVAGDSGDSFSSSSSTPSWFGLCRSSSFPLFASGVRRSRVAGLETVGSCSDARRPLGERDFSVISPSRRFPRGQRRECGITLSADNDEEDRNCLRKLSSTPSPVTSEEERCLLREFDQIMLRRGANTWGPVVSPSAVMSLRDSLHYVCSSARAFMETETLAEVLGNGFFFSPRPPVSPSPPRCSSSAPRTSQGGFCSAPSTVSGTNTAVPRSTSAAGRAREEGSCPGDTCRSTAAQILQNIHRQRGERKKHLRNNLITFWRLLDLELSRVVGLPQEPAWVCAFLDFLNQLFLRLPCCVRLLFFSAHDVASRDTSPLRTEGTSEGREKQELSLTENPGVCTEKEDRRRTGISASLSTSSDGCRSSVENFALPCVAEEDDVAIVSEMDGEINRAISTSKGGPDEEAVTSCLTGETNRQVVRQDEKREEEGSHDHPSVKEVADEDFSERGWLIKQVLEVVHATLKRLDNNLPDDVASIHSVRTLRQKKLGFSDQAGNHGYLSGQQGARRRKHQETPYPSDRWSSSLPRSPLFGSSFMTEVNSASSCDDRRGSGTTDAAGGCQSPGGVFLLAHPEIARGGIKEGREQKVREEADHVRTLSRASFERIEVRGKQRPDQASCTTYGGSIYTSSQGQKNLDVSGRAQSSSQGNLHSPHRRNRASGRLGRGHGSGTENWTEILKPLNLAGDEQLPRYPLPFFYRMLFYGQSGAGYGPLLQADQALPLQQSLLPSPCFAVPAWNISSVPPLLWSFLFVLQRLFCLLETIATALIKYEQRLCFLLRHAGNSPMSENDNEASEKQTRDFSRPWEEDIFLRDKKQVTSGEQDDLSTLSRFFALHCFSSERGHGTSVKPPDELSSSFDTFLSDFRAASRLYMESTVLTELHTLRSSLFLDFFVPLDAFPALHEILQMHALTNPPIAGEPLSATLLTLVQPWLIEEVQRMERDGVQQKSHQSVEPPGLWNSVGRRASDGENNISDYRWQRDEERRSRVSEDDQETRLSCDAQQRPEVLKDSLLENSQQVGMWLEASLDFFQHPPPPLSELRLAAMDLVRKILFLSGYSFGELLQMEMHRSPGSEPMRLRSPVEKSSAGIFESKGSSPRGYQAAGNVTDSLVRSHEEESRNFLKSGDKVPFLFNSSENDPSSKKGKQGDLSVGGKRGRVPGRDLLQAISVFVCCESSLWMKKNSLWLYGAPFLQCASFFLRCPEAKMTEGEEKRTSVHGCLEEQVDRPEVENYGEIRLIEGREEEGRSGQRIRLISSTPRVARGRQGTRRNHDEEFLSKAGLSSSLLPLETRAAECAALSVRESALRVFEALLLQPNNEELFLGRLESWNGSTPYTSTLIQRVVILAWYLARPLSSLSRPWPPPPGTRTTFPLYRPVELQQLLDETSLQLRQSWPGLKTDQTYLRMLTNPGGKQSASGVDEFCFSSADFPRPRLSFVRQHFSSLRRVRHPPSDASSPGASPVCAAATRHFTGSPCSPRDRSFDQKPNWMHARHLAWNICRAHISFHSVISPEEAHYVRAELLRSSLCSALAILTHKVRLGGWEADKLLRELSANSPVSAGRDQTSLQSTNERNVACGSDGTGGRVPLVPASRENRGHDVAQHSEQHFLSSELLGRTWPLLRALAGVLEAEGCENEFSVLGSFQQFSTLIHAALI
ncbi:hypothetical protein CSUI_001157 [Cystoisospora suis]|uniref:Uncharacterized protein n=1 Tax=Cystoisospora suis TaxID=483139 RepID=A0A2C6LBF2_9APIC|nr:hypothetical protein CSUI_001157 [Cystoisospora suis]